MPSEPKTNLFCLQDKMSHSQFDLGILSLEEEDLTLVEEDDEEATANWLVQGGQEGEDWKGFLRDEDDEVASGGGGEEEDAAALSPMTMMGRRKKRSLVNKLEEMANRGEVTQMRRNLCVAKCAISIVILTMCRLNRFYAT
jgi:hypothetical protein